jgi:DNA-binding response OmpR family regulator
MMDRKALIVEDEPHTGQLLAQILAGLGFDSAVLHEGKPAVPWVQSHKPDLVLLDLMLPDMSGYDICQQLKLDRQTNLIPIIIVTALVGHEDMIHGLKVGANHYLTKPFGLEQLEQAVEQVMKWKQDLEKSGTQGEIRFQFKSDTRHLDELNHLLASLYLHTHLTQDQSQQLMMAVREMGTNAIEWGNRNQAERLVTVTYRIDKEKIVILIRDSGPGFDPRNLPHAASLDDPMEHLDKRNELGLRAGGFGILMARGLVDELKYNETGNEVKLVKRFAKT